MQVFILQYFTKIVKNLKKRENTENLCLIIRGSQVQALVGPHKALPKILWRGLLFPGVSGLHFTENIYNFVAVITH